MTESLPDRWHSRDLPVLRHIVRRLDERVGGVITVHETADALAMSVDDITRAGLNLKRDRLVETLEFEEGLHGFTDFSADASRAVGMWPTPETSLDRMIAALQAIAENTDALEDDRSRARKALDGLTGAGRHIGISVATAAITGQLPT